MSPWDTVELSHMALRLVPEFSIPMPRLLETSSPRQHKRPNKPNAVSIYGRQVCKNKPTPVPLARLPPPRRQGCSTRQRLPLLYSVLTCASIPARSFAFMFFGGLLVIGTRSPSVRPWEYERLVTSPIGGRAWESNPPGTFNAPQRF